MTDMRPGGGCPRPVTGGALPSPSVGNAAPEPGQSARALRRSRPGASPKSLDTTAVIESMPAVPAVVRCGQRRCPRAPHAEQPTQRALVSSADTRGDRFVFAPARRRTRARPARRDRRHARPPVPPGGGHGLRRSRRPAGLHWLPARALEDDLVVSCGSPSGRSSSRTRLRSSCDTPWLPERSTDSG